MYTGFTETRAKDQKKQTDQNISNRSRFFRPVENSGFSDPRFSPCLRENQAKSSAMYTPAAAVTLLF
jgi:hypothetical protein